MKIAEFFVQMGIKGAEKTTQALGGIQKGMFDLSSQSLLTKAGILGMLYGLERLTNIAGEQGMALLQFANYTGLSTDRLQKWQYVARQSGVSAEEMTGSIKGIQDAMSKMRTGQGAPMGWSDVARTVGLDFSKVDDTFYVIDKLKEYAKTTNLPRGLANQYLASFGLSESTIQMLRTTRYEIDKVKPGNIFSSREISQLASIKVQWENFWDGIKKAGVRIAGSYSPEVIKNLQGAFDWVLTTIQNIRTLIKEIPEIGAAFKAVGLIVAAYFAPMTTIFAGITMLLNEWQKKRKGEDNIFDDLFGKKDETGQDKINRMDNMINKVKSFLGLEEEYTPEMRKGPLSSKVKSLAEKPSPLSGLVGVAPKMQPISGAQNNINVQQTLQFQHDGKNAQKTGESTSKAIKDAFYQMPALAGGH